MKNPLLLLLVLSAPAFVQAQAPASGSRITPPEAVAALHFHNKIRAEVGAPGLQWSADLSGYAQKWADHLAAEGCALKHRPMSGEWAQQHGENIFWGSGRYFDATEASQSWYSEKKDFRYGPITESNYSRVGHYTQMVWKASTHLGMGAAQCRNGSWIIVANYSPRGNYIGVKPY
ncbi:CAP family protein [Flaviaesturariibacter amylovorans]|uniref:CAP domain-containing protein n=1 Tax=Flaviaesturariibacter amylovorans TaxID=1084520 RepID=A0ABP8G7M9_9BACT